MHSPPFDGLFRKLNICSRFTAASRGISRRGRAVCTARMNLIEISAVCGDHQSSGGRRAERRKQDGEERHPGFYDLASWPAGVLSCLSAFRVRERLLASLKAGTISLRRNLVARKQIRRPCGFKGTGSVDYQAAIKRLDRFGAITTPHHSPDAIVQK